MVGPTVEGSIVAHVQADIANLEENITRAEAKVEELTGKRPEVTVKANVDQALTKLAAVEAASDRVSSANGRLSRAVKDLESAEQSESRKAATLLPARREATAALDEAKAAVQGLMRAQAALAAEEGKARGGGSAAAPAAAAPAAGGVAAVAGVAVAAIVGGMSTVAALANAAVAGLLILANAFGAVMVAGGLLMVAFSGLSAQLAVVTQQQTLAAIPTNQLTKAQGAQLDQLNATIAGYGAYVGTISTLKTALGGLRDDITSALFTAATPGIAAVTNSLLPQVKGALLGYATVVGNSLSSVLSSLSSAGGVDALNKLLKGAQTLLPPITAAAQSLGSVLGHVFIDALPATQGFVDGLAKITDRFNTFISSNPDKVKQFFTDGVSILGAFGGVLSGIGKTMSSLVTPAVVKQTVDFLNTLRDSAPFWQTLFQAAGKLEIFNLVAQVFDKVGNALRPLLNVLAPVLSIISSLATNALTGLGFALQAVGLILTPVGWGFQLIADILAKLQPYMDYMSKAGTAMFDVFQKGADAIWKGIKPALDDLFKSIFGGLPTPARLAEVFQTKVLPALQAFTDTMVKDIVPVVSIAIGMLSDFVKSLGGFDGIKAKLEAAAGFFRTFGTAVGIALAPIEASLRAISTLFGLVTGKQFPSVTQNTVAGGLGAAKHAGGGTVGGTGSSTSDSNLVRLSVGEEVIRTASANQGRPFLKMFNQDPGRALAAVAASGAAAASKVEKHSHLHIDGGGMNVDALYAEFQRRTNALVA